MLNFSRTSRYALRALMYLAKSKGRPYVKIKEIAKNEEIPLNFLSKIFQILTKNGIVDSCPGPRGGVKLSFDSHRISVADILTIIDGRMKKEDCTLFGYQRCPELKGCLIQNECKNARRKLWNKLENMRLSSL